MTHQVSAERKPGLPLAQFWYEMESLQGPVPLALHSLPTPYRENQEAPFLGLSYASGPSCPNPWRHYPPADTLSNSFRPWEQEVGLT